MKLEAFLKKEILTLAHKTTFYTPTIKSSKTKPIIYGHR